MKGDGTFDRTTIVILSDHGFRFGGRERDPRHIPFIVKMAGQRTAEHVSEPQFGESLLPDVLTRSCALPPPSRTVKPRERVGTERVAERDVGRITPTGNQDAPDPGGVVPRIKRVPAPSEIGLKPCGEVHWAPGRDADVAEIARAGPRGNVHAAAERDARCA